MLRHILSRPTSVAIAALTLVILGFFSLLRLPVSLLPTLERPRLVVSVRDADAAREDLVRRVAQPLERRLMSLPGVLEVHSTVEDGACTLRLETEWQTDIDRLRIDAERRLSAVSAADVDRLEVRVEAGDRAPVLQIAVLGGAMSRSHPSGVTPSALTVFADKVVIPELGRVEGAGRLRRLGGASLRPVVRPNAAALAAHGLTAGDLIDRLGRVGRSRPAGRLRDGAAVRPLLIHEPVRSVAELAATRLPGDANEPGRSRPGPFLGELASVAMEEVPDGGIFRRGGEDGVLVEVHRAPGANAVLLARAAREVVAELQTRAGAGPGSPRLEVVRDASEEVTAALGTLAIAAGLGLLLGTLVLRFMLGSWRPTVALAVVVPASIIATFGGFHLGGVSLDAVSLAGLALAAGMLIDNSIVVLEAIAAARARAARARRKAGGEPSAESPELEGTRQIAVALHDAEESPELAGTRQVSMALHDATESPELEGTRQISMALIASFLTTAVVFLPLIYLQGLARAFFGVQAFAIVTSLAVSLALSLTLTPVLARSARAGGEGGSPAGRSPLRAFYLAALDRALARPWPVMVATVALLAAAGLLLPSLPRELLPAGLSKVLAVEYRLPAGLGRDEAARRVQELERAAQLAANGGEPEEVDLVSTYRHREASLNSAADASRGADPSNDPSLDGDRGEIELTFSDAGALAATRVRLERRLARVPGIDAEVFVRRGAVASTVERSARRLEIELMAATAPRVDQLAERVVERLRGHGVETRRAGDAATGSARPAWVLAWDTWRLAQLDRDASGGADTDRLESQVRAALGGFHAGRADIEGAEPEILVAATRPQDPALIPVRPRAVASAGSPGDTGPAVLPLAALARVERRLEPPPAERLGGRPAVRLAVVANDSWATPADIERALSGLPLGPDERVRLGGQTHEMRRSFTQLRLALVLALVLVFLTVAALYESLTLPLVVMTTVPVAAAGAFAALRLAGQSLNVMSFLGLILLTGIVVNNAIVLMHRVEQRASAGGPPTEAVREAAGERYRPILMTTLTTLLGMLPLALLGGEGAEMRAALAIAVCGGLVTSLFATLFVVPVLHRAVARGKVRGGG